MGKKCLSKKMKSIVSLSAVTAMLLGQIVPVNAAVSQDSNTTSSTQKYRNVMYYGDWSIWGGQDNFYPQDIPADQLTHLNFAFMDFNSSGELQFTDKDAACGHPLGHEGITYGDINGGILNEFQVLKIENPNLKIGVSLGGWSKSGDFTAVCKNASTRAKFIENVLAFIKYTNMDFVDIDWEYPTAQRDPDTCDNSRDEGTKDGCPEDRQYFIDLLKDFRTALDKQGKELGKTYELSAALPAPIAKVESGIDVEQAFKYLDFANIMTYDMRGAWDPISGHQTALYTNPNDPYAGLGLSIDESVKYYESQGAPSEKIVIGAAYYTRGWECVANDGTDSNNPGLFGTAKKEYRDADNTLTTGALPELPLKDGDGGRRTGTWAYRSLDDLKVKYPGLKEYWDDTAKAPYLYNEETGAFFTYDNARSIQEKCKYVKENNLGGMIAWMASMDAPTDSSSTVRDELTKVTKQALYGDEELKANAVSFEPLDLSISMSKGAGAYGTGGTITMTITNNSKVTSSGEVLSSVETAAKSIKNAKVYIETEGITITGSNYPTPAVTQEDGYSVLDLGGLFEGKIWSPGTSKTFTLTTSEEPENLDGILSVFITQRMYPAAPEYNKQILVGPDSENQIIDSNGNALPTISGLKKTYLTIKDSFDPLAGVTSYDREDGDLTDRIKVTGSVNTSKVGTYTLTYSVTDNNGATRTATRDVIVKYKSYIEEDNYDPTKKYVQGDVVVYNGHYWELIYLTDGGYKPGEHPLFWKDLGEARVEIIEDEDEPSIVTLAQVAALYRVKKTDANYDANCDINSDGIIDIVDIVLVAKSM